MSYSEKNWIIQNIECIGSTSLANSDDDNHFQTSYVWHVLRTDENVSAKLCLSSMLSSYHMRCDGKSATIEYGFSQLKVTCDVLNHIEKRMEPGYLVKHRLSAYFIFKDF